MLVLQIGAEILVLVNSKVALKVAAIIKMQIDHSEMEQAHNPQSWALEFRVKALSL